MSIQGCGKNGLLVITLGEKYYFHVVQNLRLSAMLSAGIRKFDKCQECHIKFILKVCCFRDAQS